MTFTFQGRGKTAAFKFNGNTCRGLHKLLRKCFYPEFVFPRPREPEVKGAKGRPGKKKKSPKEMMYSRGRQIDNNLIKWTRSADPSKIPKRTHAWTKMLIAAFQKWGWSPLEAQGIVGIPEKRVATAFDLLMQNKKGEKVMVEVKSGFNGNFTTSNDQKLTKPLEDVESHPLNHALLQASVTASYFRNTRPDEPLKHVYVVLVNDRGCERFKPPEWMPKALKAFNEFLENKKGADDDDETD